MYKYTIEDIIEITDELEVLLGLFIPTILAWKLIKTFISEGKASR